MYHVNEHLYFIGNGCSSLVYLACVLPKNGICVLQETALINCYIGSCSVVHDRVFNQLILNFRYKAKLLFSNARIVLFFVKSQEYTNLFEFVSCHSVAEEGRTQKFGPQTTQFDSFHAVYISNMQDYYKRHSVLLNLLNTLIFLEFRSVHFFNVSKYQFQL